MERLIFVIVGILCAQLCESYHILVLFPHPGRSHSILGYGIVDRLLEAGHEVTFLTPFPRKNENPKLHIIDNTVTLPLLSEDLVNIEMILNKTLDVQNLTSFYEMITKTNQVTFDNVNVQKMLKDDRVKFDAVIAEWLMSDFINSYAEYYQVPLILFGSTEPHSLLLKLVDEVTNPAYIPTILSNGKSLQTFVQRTKELFLSIVLDIFLDFYIMRTESTFYEESMAKLIAKKGRVPPPYSVIKYNASLLLGNSHVSLGSALRLPQSYKPIGGYHINTVVPPLPKDLQKIMDSAVHGVIYFSLGSNVKSKFMPNTMKSDLLNLFGSLKETVIWKFEDVLPNLPKNVHILQWAPQPSILAHPKTILFITHGGLLSTTETIHYGKPTIGIPVFGDQFSNVERSVNKGFALKVDLSYNLAADLKVAIEEILGNPKYSQKAKELSFVYHDRPVPPGKELVHWVEHVIKTRGAPHLRSPALDTPWYQKLYLDLAAVVLTIMIIIKKLITTLCCRKKVDLKKKRN